MIIVDTREPKKYQVLGHKVDAIWVDYIVEGEHGKYAIERKTWNDFTNSLNDGRIWEQLERLKQLRDDYGYTPIVAIHGNIYPLLRSKRLNEPRLMGFIAHCITEGIHVVTLPNAGGFTMLLYKLNDRVEGVHKKSYVRPAHIKKTGRAIHKEVKDVLMSFYGIGASSAEAILKKYKTLRNVFKSEDISDVVSERVSQHMQKVLDYEWGDE